MSDTFYRIQSDQRAFRDWQEDDRPDNRLSLQRARKMLPIALRDYVSDTQKKYLFAYFGEGLTIPQIAERYGVNKATVSRTIGRGLDRLYDCLRFVSPEFSELEDVRKALRIDNKTGCKQRKMKRHYTKRRKYSARTAQKQSQGRHEAEGIHPAEQADPYHAGLRAQHLLPILAEVLLTEAPLQAQRTPGGAEQRTDQIPVSLILSQETEESKVKIILKHKPPITQMDKLCALFLAAAFLAPNFAVIALDMAAYRAAETAEADKPTAITVAAPDIDFTPLVESIEAAREVAEDDPYDETIPLDRDLQAVLREACEENGVAVCDALGVIEVESGFDPEASNGVCVGLMQTNEKYASKFKDATGYSIYTPEGNIRGGVWYLGTLLEKYKGDIQAALCAYNAGHDTGARGYAKAVLASSEQWGCG